MDLIHLYVTRDAKILLLEELSQSTKFEVSELQTVEEVSGALTLAAFRHSSSARFRCLFNKVLSNTPAGIPFIGRFFQVTLLDRSRYPDSCDIVYVSPCGSLACTSPFYSNSGIVGKHILSVFRFGHITLNVACHFHPLYLQHHAVQLALVKDMASVSRFTCEPSTVKNCTKLIGITALTSWQWCVQFTESEWREQGLGGDAHQAVVFPLPSALTSIPESAWERIQKSFNYLSPILRYDEAEREHFFFYFTEMQARARAAAEIKDQALRASNGLNILKVTVPSAKGRKRKKAGGK